MKALTVWQPWASLIMIGAKPLEFRPRSFRAYISPPRVGDRIGIHAAKRQVVRSEIAELMMRLERNDIAALGLLPSPESSKKLAAAMDLLDRWWRSREGLPLAAMLGTAIIGEPKRAIDVFSPVMDPDEIDPDIWAWPMQEVQPFERPVPAKGAQGFWNWKEAA